MAKQNYGFQKRQRELAKKQKKEDKKRMKEAAQAAGEMSRTEGADDVAAVMPKE
jgi:hypothetical protein